MVAGEVGRGFYEDVAKRVDKVSESERGWCRTRESNLALQFRAAAESFTITPSISHPSPAFAKVSLQFLNAANIEVTGVQVPMLSLDYDLPARKAVCLASFGKAWQTRVYMVDK